MSATQQKTTNQSDLLLWIAGGAVAAIGVAWLVIMKPWAGGDVAEPAFVEVRQHAPHADPVALIVEDGEGHDPVAPGLRGLCRRFARARWLQARQGDRQRPDRRNAGRESGLGHSSL